MLTLAIEQSSGTAGVALFRGRDLVGEDAWSDTRLHAQNVFVSAPALLARCGAGLADVDLFAVGLGPGSFSGLRIAISATRSFAMPGGKAVYGVSSGEALARDLAAGGATGTIAVVGDARRNRVWYAIFAATDGEAAMTVPYSLAPLEALPGLIPAGATLASPDWHRLGQDLERVLGPRVTSLRRSVSPTARSIGAIAIDRMARGVPPPPPIPIYLHPPVIAEPKR